MLLSATQLDCYAISRSSATYQIVGDTVDTSGAHASSPIYSNDGSTGLIGNISTASLSDELSKSGYIGQLYEVVGLQITAANTTVDEGTTKQLAGSQLLDDDTLISLPTDSVTWSVQSGPIAGISNAGLATAGTVFQDTNATVHGLYLGLTGSLGLSVINVSNDDIPGYSGDGIDDAWQVQYFGLNNSKAGPSEKSDGTGLTNLFKYIAGLIPGDSNSNFNQSNAPVPGQQGQQSIMFSPIVTGRTYTVQSSTDLGNWQPLIHFTTIDIGNVRTVTDIDAVGSQKFYRVLISKP